MGKKRVYDKTREKETRTISLKKIKPWDKPLLKSGRVYIQATYNNILMTATDLQGKIICWQSAGSSGFKGPKKATPYAAGIVAKSLCDKLREKGVGLEEIDVLIKGVGSGRESSLKGLQANGLKILSIRDITPIPHDGCRAPKPRRV